VLSIGDSFESKEERWRIFGLLEAQQRERGGESRARIPMIKIAADLMPVTSPLLQRDAAAQRRTALDALVGGGASAGAAAATGGAYQASAPSAAPARDVDREDKLAYLVATLLVLERGGAKLVSMNGKIASLGAHTSSPCTQQFSAGTCGVKNKGMMLSDVLPIAAAEVGGTEEVPNLWLLPCMVKRIHLIAAALGARSVADNDGMRKPLRYLYTSDRHPYLSALQSFALAPRPPLVASPPVFPLPVLSSHQRRALLAALEPQWENALMRAGLAPDGSSLARADGTGGPGVSKLLGAMSGLGPLIHLHGLRLRRLLTSERDTPLLAAGPHPQVYALGAWLRFLMPYLFVDAQETAFLLPHLANPRYSSDVGVLLGRCAGKDAAAADWSPRSSAAVAIATRVWLAEVLGDGYAGAEGMADILSCLPPGEIPGVLCQLDASRTIGCTHCLPLYRVLDGAVALALGARSSSRVLLPGTFGELGQADELRLAAAAFLAAERGSSLHSKETLRGHVDGLMKGVVLPYASAAQLVARAGRRRAQPGAVAALRPLWEHTALRFWNDGQFVLAQRLADRGFERMVQRLRDKCPPPPPPGRGRASAAGRTPPIAANLGLRAYFSLLARLAARVDGVDGGACRGAAESGGAWPGRAAARVARAPAAGRLERHARLH